MRQKPLVALAALYSLGILSADKILLPLFWLNLLAALGVPLGFLFVRKRWVFDIILTCFVFFLGVVTLRNSMHLGKSDISRFVTLANDNPYMVQGVIIHKPILKNNSAVFLFQPRLIKSAGDYFSCSGQILVHVKTKKGFVYGEELVLRGKLRRPLISGQNIRFLMSVKTDADYFRSNKLNGFWLKRFAFRLVDKMEAIIFRYTPSLTAGILDAMILGEKRRLPGFINTIMMRTGTLHILVVSGFNVGIVSFIALLILKLARIPRPWRYGLTTVCLILYCLLTGASTPVVRATIMAIVFIFGILAKKEPDIRNSCALAWLFILLWNPRQLFDAGFQLSFASVIALIYVYPNLRTFFRVKFLKHKALQFLAEAFLVSFSCWVATAALIIHYFHIFSPVTVWANILIVPLATLITLCGFCLIGIGSFCAGLAPIFANTCVFLVMLLIKTNTFLAGLPLAYLTVQWQS